MNEIQTNHIYESLNYYKAITSNSDAIEKEKYKEAYNKETSQRLKMETWNTNPIKSDTVDKNHIINSMFIFTVKIYCKHKCRLVARGDQQKPQT